MTSRPVVQWGSLSAGSASIQISWSTNYNGYILEHASNLLAADWSAVSNPVTTVGDRFSVTGDARESKRFYRLFKP